MIAITSGLKDMQSVLNLVWDKLPQEAAAASVPCSWVGPAASDGERVASGRRAPRQRLLVTRNRLEKFLTAASSGSRLNDLDSPR